MRRQRPLSGRAAWSLALAASAWSSGPLSAREAELLPQAPICSYGRDLAPGVPLSIMVEASTATGYWSVFATPDGRPRPVAGQSRVGLGATWSPRDPVASRVPRRPGSGLAQLEASRGTIAAVLLDGPGSQPDAIRVRLEARGLLLDDGTPVGDLPTLDLVCRPPAPLTVPQPPCRPDIPGCPGGPDPTTGEPR